MTAIILAAGFSKRFRGNKLLAKINGKPIISRVVETVQKCGFEEIILVSRSSDVKEFFKDADIKVVINDNAALGISTSIKCGIRNARSSDSFMFFAADQPFIDEKTVKALLGAYKNKKGSIIVPKYNGVNGNPVIFAGRWKTELLMLTGDIGGRAIIKANPDKVHYVQIDNEAAGIDIDTRDDYRLNKNRENS
jgi:molybdenum cofactor cytidylyltransferase